MPKMKMGRDFMVSSTTGHMIGFTANVEISVPPVLVQECIKYGAELCKGEEAPKAPEPKIKEEPSGDERVTTILNHIESMFMRNARGDFSGSGLPDLKKLSELCGFKVDTKERNALWREFEKTQNAAPASNVD